mmetsp:Transcript_6989/g.17890  ORF Transcript_6989/g.17890 Transcript_6989/m.17890 type:complete len:241 (+) Transcript_6989:265-987(+)
MRGDPGRNRTLDDDMVAQPPVPRLLQRDGRVHRRGQGPELLARRALYSGDGALGRQHRRGCLCAAQPDHRRAVLRRPHLADWRAHALRRIRQRRLADPVHDDDLPQPHLLVPRRDVLRALPHPQREHRCDPDDAVHHLGRVGPLLPHCLPPWCPDFLLHLPLRLEDRPEARGASAGQRHAVDVHFDLLPNRTADHLVQDLHPVPHVLRLRGHLRPRDRPRPRFHPPRLVPQGAPRREDQL